MELWKTAKWIWAEGYDSVNTYLILEGRFPAEAGGRYTLAISADTDYSFEIGGRMFFGQYADYPFDKVYDLNDLGDSVTAGENFFTLKLWHQGDDSSTVRGEKAGVIWEIFDGNGAVVSSSGEDAVFRPYSRFDMGPGVEHVSGQLGYSFRFDARRPLPDPVPTVIQNKPLPTRLRPVKKLTVGEDEPAVLSLSGSFTEKRGRTLGERMQYAGISFGAHDLGRRLPSREGILLRAEEGEDGVFALIDTGRENAGILSLDLEVPEEAEILVGWGEHLDDGRVRAYVGGRNFAASYFARAGRNIFVNPFRRLGMRYLELHVYAKEVRIHYAGIRPTEYPLDTEVEFTCADSLHNRIFEVSKRTLELCMHVHYEDCPWREQALYSLDSRNQMLCGYLAFKELDFPRASLRLMAQSIRDDDMLELCSPARVSITIPAFTAIYLTQVCEYLVYSEKIRGQTDTDTARELLPVLIRIADGFIRRRDPGTGLIPCFKEAKYWNFYEWQDGLSGSIGGSVGEDAVTFDAPLCAFVSFGLRSLADILDLLGDGERAAYYRNEHKSLNESVNRYFWDEDRGAYVSYIRRSTGEKFHYAELTNALIVYADAAVGERLTSTLVSLEGKSGLIPVTLSHSIFKYDALMKDPEKYARFVFRSIADLWGSMLYQNATSFWETIEGARDFGNAGSLCHGWSAIPIRFYAEYAAEMDGEETGLYECRLKEIQLSDLSGSV